MSERFYFGKRSSEKLAMLDERLVAILFTAIAYTPIDFTVVETNRSIPDQKRLFNQGLTKTLNSKHLAQPKSLAVDVAPLIKSESGRTIIPWQSHSYFYFLAGIILHSANRFCEGKDFYIKWGGDWNGNGVFVNEDHMESFLDLCHYEICMK